MKILLFICGCISVCSAIPSFIEEWASFKAKHGKTYKSPDEEHFRFGVYMSNKDAIDKHNAQYAAGLVTYALQMNNFGDKLPEEVSAQVNGFNRSGVLLGQRASTKFMAPENLEVPARLDWREKGAVTPVKDQGQCGSCWAFSSTGSLEGQVFRKTGKLVSLSEQNLVDCATEYGNEGCSGGLMDQAFSYIKDNGIDSEESYPYEGINDKCRFLKSKVAGSAQGFVDIPAEDEEALLKAVTSVGPISVAINAGLHSFTFYKKGVYTDASCDSKLNHGVLLVGFGTEKGQDYWLVKNSWNTNWGEDGYIKIARNQKNLCGIASMASYPIV